MKIMVGSVKKNVFTIGELAVNLDEYVRIGVPLKNKTKKSFISVLKK